MINSDREILKIEAMAIGYGKGKRAREIHSGLNATMFAGELICLLGENGAGKSTLIRTLCGFQRSLGGRATILEKDLFKMSEKELSKIAAVVLTDRVTVPNATVEELVGLGRSPYTGTMGVLDSSDKDIVHSAIEKCGIVHKKYERLSNLSDGEKQKVFIAKALAQDTPVIFLDEPTAFLDMPARVEIMQLLRQIANRSDKSILMSTHDLDLALQMSDRLWLLPSNRPLMEGSPEDLLLKNEFQTIFENRGVEFDNRTGLFRVGYDFKTTLPVKGHGFEYVLIRRAFARKGIQVVRKSDDDSCWVQIDSSSDKVFNYYHNRELTISDNSIENMVKQTMKYIETDEKE